MVAYMYFWYVIFYWTEQFLHSCSQWRTQEKISGGVQGRGSGLVGGPGGGAPRTPENFRKFAKKFRRKLQKLLYFRLFCKEITNPSVKFLRVWTKNTIGWENFEKILKIFENLQKIPEENCKNRCIFAYFAKKLQNHALNFRAFGRKTQFGGEIWRKFWKFLVKIQ